MAGYTHPRLSFAEGDDDPYVWSLFKAFADEIATHGAKFGQPVHKLDVSCRYSNYSIATEGDRVVFGVNPGFHIHCLRAGQKFEGPILHEFSHLERNHEPYQILVQRAYESNLVIKGLKHALQTHPRQVLEEIDGNGGRNKFKASLSAVERFIDFFEHARKKQPTFFAVSSARQQAHRMESQHPAFEAFAASLTGQNDDDTLATANHNLYAASQNAAFEAAADDALRTPRHTSSQLTKHQRHAVTGLAQKVGGLEHRCEHLPDSDLASRLLRGTEYKCDTTVARRAQDPLSYVHFLKFMDEDSAGIPDFVIPIGTIDAEAEMEALRTHPRLIARINRLEQTLAQGGRTREELEDFASRVAASREGGKAL